MTHHDPNEIFPLDPDFAAAAHINPERYNALYQQSIADRDGFWREQAQRIDWMKPFTQIEDVSWNKDDLHIRWFADGTLNACVNCIDRHLPEKSNETAIIWEGDDPDVDKTITYGELYAEVGRLANGLREIGVKKGDRVTIYMPMVPEAAYAMLACARIGAVHSVVFGGFSPDALAGRITDCESDFVITADEGVRGGRPIPLKANVDKAVEIAGRGQKVVVVRRTGGDIAWNRDRDVWYHDLVAGQPEDCEAEEMSAEDPLFILYTSGSTGKPKGVLHTTGGYMVWASLTHEVVFDYKPGEIYWCTADVGWVTGHSYIVYGPLANGAITLMFEGVPTYPGPDRFWQVVDKHNVNIFYTAPTAIRALMREGDEHVSKHSRQSLRLLGSVGEPINPEAWTWYYRVVGNARCPIVDTWWQTETGGIMITPLPGAHDLKPGAASMPMFGVELALMDGDGKRLPDRGEQSGNLVVTRSWPGQMRTVYGDHKRFVETYFSTYDGLYFSGDGARRDADGYWWVTGRVDDVLNVSGHRLGTAEIESALVAHDDVAEAAVVGYPHDIKGQGIYCFVTLYQGREPGMEDVQALKAWVRQEIGPVATPDVIQFAPALPKTRSGKIMRRILRKIAENEYGNLGDISTLADPSVVQDLIANRAEA